MSIWMSASMGLEATLGNTVKQGAAMFVPSGAGSTHADTGDCRRLSWSARPVAVSPETLLAPCVHWQFFLFEATIYIAATCFGSAWQKT
jgi:hypothetical protein